MIFHILNKLHKNTGLDNLCIVGGVAQNSVVNGKILLNTPFKNIYVPSAGHDGWNFNWFGVYLYNHILKNRSSGIKTSLFWTKINRRRNY